MMNLQPSPQEAAKELLLRRQARASFISWARRYGLEPAAHHKLLIAKLESVAAGRLKRLAVFMPPGSAKSTYGSILFPPWYLVNRPDAAVIAASHTTELAEKWGRKVRNIVNEYAPVLGISLAGDSQAAGRWALASGGEYLAAGVGVGIAGFRADLAVIDDPIRSRDDAESELVRERIWDWYKSDLATRLKPNAGLVLIQTRWHEADLAGRIIEEMERGGDQWEVLSLPAEAEDGDPLGRSPGEFLWDDEYGYGDFLRHEKATQTPRNWSALYQQRPAPESGDFFKAEWLRPYTQVPDPQTLAIYGGSDYAVTADGGDYTVHVVIGLDAEDRLYLLDLWRGQKSSDVWIKAWCDLVKQWKPLDWAEETGQITSGLGPFIDAEAHRQKAYVNRELFASRGDKGVRAQSIRGRMAMGGLYVPVNAPWYADFRSELLSFPAGKHDDQVDALGLVGQLLDRMITGRKSPEKQKKPLSSGYRAIEPVEDSFKTY